MPADLLSAYNYGMIASKQIAGFLRRNSLIDRPQCRLYSAHRVTCSFVHVALLL